MVSDIELWNLGTEICTRACSSWERHRGYEKFPDYHLTWDAMQFWKRYFEIIDNSQTKTDDMMYAQQILHTARSACITKYGESMIDQFRKDIAEGQKTPLFE